MIFLILIASLPAGGPNACPYHVHLDSPDRCESWIDLPPALSEQVGDAIIAADAALSRGAYDVLPTPATHSIWTVLKAWETGCQTLSNTL